jgi:protocatechuate 3,4-dioxygenase beta subunit
MPAFQLLRTLFRQTPAVLAMTAAALAICATIAACRGPATAPGASPAGAEPIVGLPCEGCEAVFQGKPDTLLSRARIAPVNEPGQPMTIDGTVVDRRGRPMRGVIVYAYHTNAQGVYPTDQQFSGQAAFRHGRLRAWVQTDDNGRYTFDTIRPAGYPNTDLPAHVHMHVIEVGRCTYYIDDIMFEDDPRLTAAMLVRLTLGRGGSGVARPRLDASGVQLVTRDIALGERIPGYPE